VLQAESELKGVYTQRSVLIEVDPIDRLIEFGLAPELTYVIDPPLVAERLNVSFMIAVASPPPAIFDDEGKHVGGSWAVDHTVVVEAG